MPISTAILQYYQQIKPPTELPSDISVLNPYADPRTFELVTEFYQKFYTQEKSRIICFGINPGRFGAGITGIPFTDPVNLEQKCGISNPFEKRSELSSGFIYEMIEAFGGVNAFYHGVLISAVSPLGYVKNGVNINYYDIKYYDRIFENYVLIQIKKHLEFGVNTQVAFSIGMGKNLDFLLKINQKYQFFRKIIGLPHPRWIMQYRLGRKQEFINEYVSNLQKAVEM